MRMIINIQYEEVIRARKKISPETILGTVPGDDPGARNCLALMHR